MLRHLPIVRLLLILPIVSACHSVPEAEKMHRNLSGNWIILYPDHDLSNGRQRILYSEMQDSIVGLTGLKLITLGPDGKFFQADSIKPSGHWGITPDNIVFVEKGGKGFENFNARFSGFDDGILKLTEMVPAKSETIKLVWHLKKINGRAGSLFGDEKNAWRRPALRSETEQQIRKRLSDMLLYYSDYYSLVTDESSFFVPTRVMLPFRFYQHAIGLREFDSGNYFSHRFYDSTQAKDAHRYLSQTIRALRDDFPRRDSYVKEYAVFMKMMAEKILQE